MNQNIEQSPAASEAVEKGAAGNRRALGTGSLAEGFAVFLLLLMGAYFLKISWRKWPDPLVDFGPQLYATWQAAEGARAYHDFTWNYGPSSLFFNAALFKLFGPGLMVLVTANLVFYALILAVAYFAFRRAWGRLGAFAALAVFISVFSFSHLLAVGNYNFVTPYAPEVSHGMLLIMTLAFIVSRWCRKPSRKLAFLVGLGGGLATVMKPEFMLAGGVLGIAAVLLRWRQRAPVRAGEYLWIGVGLVLPTLAFTAWFARGESLNDAFIDASQAWWLVVVAQVQKGNVQQLGFLGLNHPWSNALREIRFTGIAALVLAGIWAAGWFINRSWSWVIRSVTAVAALVLVALIVKESVRENVWTSVGLCLPGLMVMICVVVAVRLVREFRQAGVLSEGRVMMLMLTLLAVAMLARMPLMARISHLGFFQAALAGMVVAAMTVAELPRWTGQGEWGRRVAAAGCLAVLAVGCGSIAARSGKIRADQTEVVGQGRDQFYSTTRQIDGTGALVNWAVERLKSAPPDAEVLVLPEGAMINYLARRKTPVWGMVRESEEMFVEKLRRKPPEYVVLISRDLKEFGIKRFGAPDNVGFAMVSWVGANYKSEAWLGGDPLDPNASVGSVILRRKEAVAPASVK